MSLLFGRKKTGGKRRRRSRSSRRKRRKQKQTIVGSLKDRLNGTCPLLIVKGFCEQNETSRCRWTEHPKQYYRENRLCFGFERGICEKGDACEWSHSYKCKPCPGIYGPTRTCKYGSLCQFSHLMDHKTYDELWRGLGLTRTMTREKKRPCKTPEKKRHVIKFHSPQPHHESLMLSRVPDKFWSWKGENNWQPNAEGAAHKSEDLWIEPWPMQHLLGWEDCHLRIPQHSYNTRSTTSRGVDRSVPKLVRSTTFRGWAYEYNDRTATWGERPVDKKVVWDGGNLKVEESVWS